MREGERKGGENGVEDVKSKRIKNVKFMHPGGSVLHMAHCTNVFTSNYGCGEEGGLIHGTHLWTATATLKKQLV